MIDEERVVLVGPDGQDLRDTRGAVSTAGKQDAHQRGLRHRAVSVFVFDGERMLMQRRANGKYHSRGLWTNTCCTHPRLGESPTDAATRRLREEMGVECELRELFQFTYCEYVGNGLVENELDHVFVGRWKGAPVPDESEVADWCWWGARDLERKLETDSERFTCWFRRALPRVLELKDQR
jgi:isopentenyl-diphosphate delta-isomerase